MRFGHQVSALLFCQMPLRGRAFEVRSKERPAGCDRTPREGEAILGVLRSELQRMRIACFFAGSSRASFRSLFVSDSSPFYESARLLEVEPIPRDDFARHLQAACEKGTFKASRELIDVLLAIGGQSPNDVQHLAHEVWNAAKPCELTSRELRAALMKILGDITPMAEARIEKLTRNQTRALLATALHEELGYATEAFLSVAGTTHRSAVVKALKPCLEGTDSLVEKVGLHFRVRNRFLRLWLCTQKILIQELIPQLREEGQYRALGVSPAARTQPARSACEITSLARSPPFRHTCSHETRRSARCSRPPGHCGILPRTWHPQAEPVRFGRARRFQSGAQRRGHSGGLGS